ncbi:hypothetical protein A7E78_05565 [Syntrophotalea acetylenivorans]|uniref:Perosamine synthetase n=1 Tax=Syntrophotalea acetylenivorans TaxID=1842532 RepID=A0A1L3GSW6_9BACT|nr:hypothetical protein A7E78_05565 [Syntrophotalea acetylenivorans]
MPLCVPEIRGNEWQYVKNCLDTSWVSSVGAYVDRFEQKMAERLGAPFHGVATVNGTAALHTALLVAGVQPDDEVLVSDLTFIAPANAIRYAGAWPVLIDAEPGCWQMDPQQVELFLTRDCEMAGGVLRNRQSGRRVKAIIPVHILGHPVDLDPIMELAGRFDLVVIEDATEGLGGHYRGSPLGGIGHIGCYSFNGNKMITTGGGGMLVTGNPQWAEKARYLTTQAKDDPLEYIHGELGFNYRLTNLQAAMGCAQLEQLDAYLSAKEAIADRYRQELCMVPGITPMPTVDYGQSAWWLYTVRVDPAQYGMDRKTLMQRLAAEGIQTRPLWQPLHLSPVYRQAQRIGGEVSEQLNSSALSLPCSVGLSAAEQQRVIEALVRLGG